MTRVLDTLAPLKTKTVNTRSKVQWFDNDLKAQRKIVRRREEIWKKYNKLPHLWAALRSERKRYNHMLHNKRSDSITRRVLGAKKDTKKLHSIINTELGKSNVSPLPPTSSDSELADGFAHFFHDKIVKIRENLATTPPERFDEIKCNNTLTEFQPITSGGSPLNHDEDDIKIMRTGPNTDKNSKDNE